MMLDQLLLRFVILIIFLKLTLQILYSKHFVIFFVAHKVCIRVKPLNQSIILVRFFTQTLDNFLCLLDPFGLKFEIKLQCIHQFLELVILRFLFIQFQEQSRFDLLKRLLIFCCVKNVPIQIFNLFLHFISIVGVK